MQVLARHPSAAPLIERGKNLTRTSSGRSSKIGKLMLKPVSRFSLAELMRYFISLPLNMVPGLGTTFFLVYNGKLSYQYECTIGTKIVIKGTKSGPKFHDRYFALKGQNGSERAKIIAGRRGAYTSHVNIHRRSSFPFLNFFSSFLAALE